MTVALQLLLALVLTLTSTAAIATPTESERATLTELGSVLVTARVEGDGPPADLDLRAVEDEMKATLRRAGLTVHESVQEARKKNQSDLAILVASIDLAPAPGQVGTFPYVVDLQLKQMTTLLRDPSRRALAITWSASDLGSGGTSAIREAVVRLTDAFVGDYRAANPRPEP